MQDQLWHILRVSMPLFDVIRKYGLWSLLRKTMNYLRGLYYRTRMDECGPLQVTGKISVCKRHAKISLGKCLIWKGVKFDMEGRSNASPALLRIGDHTTIGDRTEIHVAQKVTIGARCKIAWDCVIMDRNYHGIGAEEETIEPVLIQDDVWIGCRSIILPGITIGHHSIIAAGSVVTKDVAPATLVGGNPARVIRTVIRNAMDH